MQTAGTVKIAAVGLAPIFALVNYFCFAPSLSSPPLQVQSEAQLFIDYRFIESAENVRLVVVPPLLPAEDVLTSEAPWEQGGSYYTTVLEDNGVYKAWYEGQGWDPEKKRSVGRFQCYATSRDGIRWDKPFLGIIEFQGSSRNNLVMAGASEGTFFIDPVAKPEQRYKFIGMARPDPLWSDSAETNGSIYICYSADGIHWKRVDQAVLPFYCDTQNQAFWDPRLGKYVAYLRSWNPLRTVSRAEVQEITQPWPYDGAVKPLFLWGEKHLPALTTQLPVVLSYDDRDPVISDLYNPCVVPYPHAQDVYLAFPSAYLHYDGVPYKLTNPLQKLSTSQGNDGSLDIQLAVSRDGMHWIRPDRAPFIPLGPPGSGRASQIYVFPSMLRKGDELWLYYVSSDTTHGGRDLSHGFGPEPEAEENFPKRHYRRAVVPLHRFIAARSPWEGGSLTTPPLVFSGSELELNIDTSAMGVARVEILDQVGKIIEGFALQDCDPINGNMLRHIVSWNGRTDLSLLKGKPVRLRFVSRSTDLFAFRFVP